MKKGSDMFDVSLGTYNGVEVGELIERNMKIVI